MIGLWADIRHLDEAGFQQLIEGLAPGPTKPAKKSRAKKTKALPANDAPATRIAHHLRAVMKLDDSSAMDELAKALIAAGTRQPIPPPKDGQTLEEWLEELFSVVSDGKVFAIASELPNQS